MSEVNAEKKQAVTPAKKVKKEARKTRECRRFAIVFPFDVSGYVKVQSRVDSFSIVSSDDKISAYHLTLNDVIGICQFMKLHHNLERLNFSCVEIAEKGVKAQLFFEEWLAKELKK